jgi:predicted N-acyltransferase
MAAIARDRRSESDQPSLSLKARCAESLASVPQGRWDELVTAGSGPLKYDYLSAWENIELSGFRSRPVLAFADDSDAPLAACPGYFYDLDLLTVRWPQASGVVDATRRIWPHFMSARTYELGSPTPLSNPFLVPDPDLRPAAVRALIEAGLEEAARGNAQFTLVQNFTSMTTPAGQLLAELGFAAVPMLPTAVVHLAYGSFEEYLGAMRAQYRRRAQQTLKRSGHLTVEHHTEFSSMAEELAALWHAVYDRATEVKREVLTPEFFAAASSAEDASVLLTRRPDGSIASFALLLDDDPWLSFLHCGFEKNSRDEGAYFRLLYEIVRFGIEQGYEQVELGMTTLAPKLDVGAVPIPLFAWIRHRHPLIQRLLAAVGRGTHEELKPRRVFKEATPGAEELVGRRAITS